jgi:hypothetical protein
MGCSPMLVAHVKDYSFAKKSIRIISNGNPIKIKYNNTGLISFDEILLISQLNIIIIKK